MSCMKATTTENREAMETGTGVQVRVSLGAPFPSARNREQRLCLANTRWQQVCTSACVAGRDLACTPCEHLHRRRVITGDHGGSGTHLAGRQVSFLSVLQWHILQLSSPIHATVPGASGVSNSSSVHTASSAHLSANGGRSVFELTTESQVKSSPFFFTHSPVLPQHAQSPLSGAAPAQHFSSPQSRAAHDSSAAPPLAMQWHLVHHFSAVRSRPIQPTATGSSSPVTEHVGHALLNGAARSAAWGIVTGPHVMSSASVVTQSPVIPQQARLSLSVGSRAGSQHDRSACSGQTGPAHVYLGASSTTAHLHVLHQSAPVPAPRQPTFLTGSLVHCSGSEHSSPTGPMSSPALNTTWAHLRSPSLLGTIHLPVAAQHTGLPSVGLSSLGQHRFLQVWVVQARPSALQRHMLHQLVPQSLPDHPVYR
eukprot:Rhum_TRINITY_DN15052_c0_g1::Rhum_TRINITY_DN15052_c0_g1_i2::g.134986::m.134986